MIDFAEARRMMVDGQIRTYDVTDLRVLAAMGDVRRELFVPADKQPVAYLDRDIEVLAARPGRPRRCLLKPMVLAKLLQFAEIDESCRVLDVGCATGYSSAVLGLLAGSVVALEEDDELAETARRLLSGLGLDNVSIATGPLAQGATALGPYDVILLGGSTEIVPKTLFRQLKEDGRLACVLGLAPVGKAMIYRCTSGHVTGQPRFDAVAPLLPGFAKAAEFVF